MILNNPPYYKKHPVTPTEHAWFAGENLEYFNRIFMQAKSFIKPNGRLLMVLSNDCDLGQIQHIAGLHNWKYKKVYSRINLIEKTHVFEFKIAN